MPTALPFAQPVPTALPFARPVPTALPIARPTALLVLLGAACRACRAAMVFMA
jgi:hypothetical protein